VETDCWNVDMCRSESSRSDESRARQEDLSKAYSKPGVLNFS